MKASTVKLTTLKRVVHVGTLKASDKGVRGDSLEGSGLSFSKHPAEWTRIAKLGGQPWWETDLTGYKIADGHALIKAHEAELGAWGVKQGLATRGTAYRVSWTDDEMGRVSMLVNSQKEADAEVEDVEDARIKKIDTFLPTAELLKAMRHCVANAGKPSVQIMQDLATLWSEKNGLHGIWWRDTLDPDCYSAPRGVIFKEHIDKKAFVEIEAPAPGRRPSFR